MKNEKLALKIATVLKKVCPAIKYEKVPTAVWHGCHCEATGQSCVCVWHLTSECNGGKWKELGFVDKHNAKVQAKRNKMLDKIVAARN